MSENKLIPLLARFPLGSIYAKTSYLHEILAKPQPLSLAVQNLQRNFLSHIDGSFDEMSFNSLTEKQTLNSPNFLLPM